jgi:hypothetical protein
VTPTQNGVVGDQALANFRRGLTGRSTLTMLRNENGRLLVQLPVGVGKTELLVQTAAAALAGNTYDLVVVLCPRTDLLVETEDRLRAARLTPCRLRPRPADDCGSLNANWLVLERQGCGLLARETLCDKCCKLRPSCFWPNQRQSLQGQSLVLAAQTHLKVDPLFISTLRQQTGATRPLVLLDETDVIVRSSERDISREDLHRFFQALRDAMAAQVNPTTGAQQWVDLTDILIHARDNDLQDFDADWSFPPVDPDWALAVQQAGWAKFGADFRFLGHELTQMQASERWSRGRSPDGGLRFAFPATLGHDFVVFSGSAAPGLVSHRLDPENRLGTLHSPFDGVRFAHPGTRWFNIASTEAAARNFPGNQKRILDFFAQLLVRNARARKRTLLVSRKQFRKDCASYLQAELGRLGLASASIVTDDWANHDLTNPEVFPLITYGVCGLNLFEEYDAAFCLTGYYAPPEAVEKVVNDLQTAHRFTVRIDSSGSPARRQVSIDDDAHSATIAPRLAVWVFEEKEANVIVQAVGRVRPFTRPREIITYHAGKLPGVDYAMEFENLIRARAFFKVANGQKARRNARAAQARELRNAGRTHAQVAQSLGISEATAKRYLRTLKEGQNL